MARPSPAALEVVDLTHTARLLVDAQALFLDPEQVALWALVQGDGPAAPVAQEELRRSVEQLMARQYRASVVLALGNSVTPVVEQAIASVGSIAEALGLSRVRALEAAVRFNGLPEITRQAFFLLKATGEPPAPADLAPWLPTAGARQAPIDLGTIQRWLLSSVQALLGREEISE